MATSADLRFGETIDDALKEFGERGYTGSFRISGPDRMMCLECRKESAPSEVRLVDMIRVEGASDPADESVIAAVKCPSCKTRATLVLSFGSAGAPEDAAVFQELQDRRVDRT